jgi:DNA-binding NtrC family response regulator
MKAGILVIEDDRLLNRLLVDQLERFGFMVEGRTTWRQAELWLEANEPDLVILDYRLPDADGIELVAKFPGIPVVVLTAHASVESAVKAIKNGASEYLVKPVNLDELELVVKRSLEHAALKREREFIKSRLDRVQGGTMIGVSAALTSVQRLIDAVAPSDMTVLVQGESGAGKELVANAIHARSPRAKANFVAVDCCTLQKDLFESELFGHEKGAFTGADRQKKGLIEGAAGGTLFLDEIGEIEISVQAKLLRVLETGRFRRVGGTKDHVADVRIVAATNRNLAQMVSEGGFRADLFYRLNAFVLTVPPLKSRREDIPELARHFIRNHDFSRRVEKSLTQDALNALTAYDWPGNIRELKNVVERAIILSGDSAAIDAEHLALPGMTASSDQFSILSVPRQPMEPLPFDIAAEPTLEEIKQGYLKYLLERHGGHRGKVAKALGISERNTYRLIGKFGLGAGPAEEMPDEDEE